MPRFGYTASMNFGMRPFFWILSGSSIRGSTVSTPRSQSRRQAGRHGLAWQCLVGVAPGDDWALAPLPASLSAREREDVRGGFYEFLLVLADAVAQAPRDKSGQPADQALRIIDRTQTLHSPPTRAYHIRRAAYLGMKGEVEQAVRRTRQGRAARCPSASSTCSRSDASR